MFKKGMIVFVALSFCVLWIACAKPSQRLIVVKSNQMPTSDGSVIYPLWMECEQELERALQECGCR